MTASSFMENRPLSHGEHYTEGMTAGILYSAGVQCDPNTAEMTQKLGRQNTVQQGQMQNLTCNF